MAYNGWANYETWVTKLWIDNEEGSHNYWQDEARRAKDAYTLGQTLREYHEENTPTAVGVYADLLTASLGDVNWFDIAESMIGDLS